jgi:hypothetical protein
VFNNDSGLTSALLDRLLHHAETIVIEGSSYRMKDQLVPDQITSRRTLSAGSFSPVFKPPPLHRFHAAALTGDLIDGPDGTEALRLAKTQDTGRSVSDLNE